MSALFLSHSSADNAIADEVRGWLSDGGYRSLFLDFDPARGIPAGRRWEQELYDRLRACQAVIVLCSPASMASPWCFAEITHARALGKPVFPLKIADCSIVGLLSDVQVVDRVREPATARERLLAGLAAAGLDPAALHDWDGRRPPYPGLLAFEREDAAVYFGREGAIRAALETLARLRRLGGPRLLLVLGASGSGKSSLARAGIVPRLAHDPSRWVIVPPFRPQARPLESLAVAVAQLPEAPDWRVLREAFATDAGTRDALADRRAAAGPEAALLLVADQFEEALVDGDEAARFLAAVRALTADPAGPVFVLATLRSDFLAAFQTHPALRELAYEPIHLPQIDRAGIAEVIAGPARVAGIELEPALADALQADAATDDTLPLLAFALRELYDGRAGGAMTLARYRDVLGGLQGAIGRSAEALCPAEPAAVEPLRRALLKLVRLDADGRFVRQPRAWPELPPAARPLLERFVQARLLVARADAAGERLLEVAHEALFRGWERLAGWLAADRAFLLWRERLHAGSAEWRRLERDPALLLRGPPLAEAQRWLDERRDDLEADDADFITASLAARDAAQAARDRRRRQLIGGLFAGLAVLAGFAGAAGWQWKRASEQSQLALARQLNAQADVALEDDIVRSLLLSVESLRRTWTPDAQAALFDRLDRLARPQTTAWKPHPGPIRGMALSPDGRWLATAGPGRLQVQSADGRVIDLQSRNGHAYLHPIAFNRQGDRLAIACEEQIVCLVDTGEWQVVHRLPRMQGTLDALAFSPDGTLLASAGRGSPQIRLHEVATRQDLVPLATAGGRVLALAFAPDGQHLAVATPQQLEVWHLGRRSVVGRTDPGGLPALVYRPDGRQLAGAAGEGALLWDLADAGDGDLALKLLAQKRPGGSGSRNFARLAFDPQGRRLAVSDDQAGVRIFFPDAPDATTLGPGPAGALAFEPGGRLLSGGLDGQIRAWDGDDRAALRIVHPVELTGAALSPDGRQLALAGADGALRLHDTATGALQQTLALPAGPTRAGYDPAGRWLAAMQDGALWLFDRPGGQRRGPFAHDGPIGGVRFEPGGDQVATTTVWDAPSMGRYGVKRPTRDRVFDIASGRELGWRYDLERDRQRATTRSGQASLDAVKDTAGGDAALAARAATWPVAFATDDVNHDPALIWPMARPLEARTAAGTVLLEAALQRTRRAEGAEFRDDHHAASADGRWLASVAGPVAQLWPLTAADLAAEACRRLPRNLSTDEWREAQLDGPYTRSCPGLPEPAGAAPGPS